MSWPRLLVTLGVLCSVSCLEECVEFCRVGTLGTHTNSALSEKCFCSEEQLQSDVDHTLVSAQQATQMQVLRRTLLQLQTDANSAIYYEPADAEINPKTGENSHYYMDIHSKSQNDHKQPTNHVENFESEPSVDTTNQHKNSPQKRTVYLDIGLDVPLSSETEDVETNIKVDTIEKVEKNLFECLALNRVLYQRKCVNDNITACKVLDLNINRYKKYQNLSDEEVQKEMHLKCIDTEMIIQHSMRDIQVTRPKKKHVLDFKGVESTTVMLGLIKGNNSLKNTLINKNVTFPLQTTEASDIQTESTKHTNFLDNKEIELSGLHESTKIMTQLPDSGVKVGDYSNELITPLISINKTVTTTSNILEEFVDLPNPTSTQSETVQTFEIIVDNDQRNRNTELLRNTRNNDEKTATEYSLSSEMNLHDKNRKWIGLNDEIKPNADFLEEYTEGSTTQEPILGETWKVNASQNFEHPAFTEPTETREQLHKTFEEYYDSYEEVNGTEPIITTLAISKPNQSLGQVNPFNTKTSPIDSITLRTIYKIESPIIITTQKDKDEGITNKNSAILLQENIETMNNDNESIIDNEFSTTSYQHNMDEDRLLGPLSDFNESKSVDLNDYDSYNFATITPVTKSERTSINISNEQLTKILPKELYSSSAVTLDKDYDILPKEDFENTTAYMELNINDQNTTNTSCQNVSCTSYDYPNLASPVTENDEIISSLHATDIKGNIYFINNKQKIPLRFIQNSNGKLDLSIDGNQLCNNLLSEDLKKSVLMKVLCNITKSKQ